MRIVDRGFLRLMPWYYLAIPGIILHVLAWAAIMGTVSVLGLSGAGIDDWLLLLAALLVTGVLALGPLAIGAWWSCPPRTIEVDPRRGVATLRIGSAPANAAATIPIRDLRLTKCRLYPPTKWGFDTRGWWVAILSGPGFSLLLGGSKNELKLDDYIASLPQELRQLAPDSFTEVFMTVGFFP